MVQTFVGFKILYEICYSSLSSPKYLLQTFKFYIS